MEIPHEAITRRKTCQLPYPLEKINLNTDEATNKFDYWINKSNFLLFLLKVDWMFGEPIKALRGISSISSIFLDMVEFFYH